MRAGFAGPELQFVAINLAGWGSGGPDPTLHRGVAKTQVSFARPWKDPPPSARTRRRGESSAFDRSS